MDDYRVYIADTYILIVYVVDGKEHVQKIDASEVIKKGLGERI